MPVMVIPLYFLIEGSSRIRWKMTRYDRTQRNFQKKIRKICLICIFEFTLYFKVLFMNAPKEDSLQVLNDIRSMMDRSSRVLSLSGWSGIWAGLVALAATMLAQHWIHDMEAAYAGSDGFFAMMLAGVAISKRFLFLAVATFGLAVLGAFYFSYRKNSREGHKTFNTAARRMIISMGIPMAAGAWMVFYFLSEGQIFNLVPTMLVFYGMTLINSAKYTISDIRWLGLFEIITGCFATLRPEWGLYFWAFGFGVLHIVYGIIMWRKYDRRQA